MKGRRLVVVVLTTLLLVGINLGYAGEIAAKERMPSFDRIALREVNLYVDEMRSADDLPPPAAKGTWARFIRRSPQNNTELVELENGKQYWADIGGFYPLYYVVGTEDLIVTMMMEDYTDMEGVYLQKVVLAHPGDTVAVDRYHKEKKENCYFAYSLDGSKCGFAPVIRLAPVGDAGIP